MINTTDEEKEQLALTASYPIADLMDAFIEELPVSMQSIIANVIANGGQLALLCVVNPLPSFTGMLMPGPGKDPVPLFAVALGRNAFPSPEINNPPETETRH